MRSGDHCYGPPRTRSITDGVRAQKNLRAQAGLVRFALVSGGALSLINVLEAARIFSSAIPARGCEEIALVRRLPTRGARVLYMRLFSIGLMLRSVALASRVGGHAAITRGLSAVRMQVATASSSPTLDERLIADEPELIKKTLRMRRADENMLQAVDRIGELTKLRAAAVAEGNDAREVRKKLSPKIGALVKNGETAEAEKLKAEVAQSATAADAADAKLEVFDAERTSLFNKLPNLLDERVVDGADDNANIEVFRWRCDDLRTGKLWHDEFGTQLGGIDMDGAAKLSGARFSVLKGGVARLERALINFFLDFHTGQHG